MSAAVFEERDDPGRFAAAVLSFLVHVLLVAVLVFGVRWQNHLPETVSVELWEPPQVAQPPRPEPRVEAPPPPRPEPRIEKPDIVEKAPPKPEPKVEKKPAPKPETRPAPLKPRVDDSQRRFREQADRERQLLAIDQELREQSARDSSAARSRALADWKQKVSASIQRRILQEITQAVPGNPEAVYEVVLYPTCEVREMRRIKSSGNAAYDKAIEDAIGYYRDAPLPKPDKSDLFESRFTVRFRPKD